MCECVRYFTPHGERHDLCEACTPIYDYSEKGHAKDIESTTAATRARVLAEVRAAVEEAFFGMDGDIDVVDRRQILSLFRAGGRFGPGGTE